MTRGPIRCRTSLAGQPKRDWAMRPVLKGVFGRGLPWAPRVPTGGVAGGVDYVRTTTPDRVIPYGASSCEVALDEVGGMGVERLAPPVVVRRGAGIGVRGGPLQVAERGAGVEAEGDERMPSLRSRRVRWYSCCSWPALLEAEPVSRSSATYGSEEEVVEQRRPQVRLPRRWRLCHTKIKQREHGGARGG